MMTSDFLPRTVPLLQELWLAQGSFVEIVASTGEISSAVNRWLRRSTSVSESGIWIMLFLAIVLLWVGLYFWERARKPKSQLGMDREGLFTQLCDLHNLSKSDRQLLRTIAKSQRIDQPALAFVNPVVLLKYVEMSPRATLEVRDLADKLFGRALVEEIVNQSLGDRVSAS